MITPRETSSDEDALAAARERVEQAAMAYAQAYTKSVLSAANQMDADEWNAIGQRRTDAYAALLVAVDREIALTAAIARRDALAGALAVCAEGDNRAPCPAIAEPAADAQTAVDAAKA